MRKAEAPPQTPPTWPREQDVEGMKEQLMRLRFIQEDLGLIDRAKSKEIRSE